MKKGILSIGLIFIFAAYVLHVRIIGANVPIVLTPEPDKPKVALSLPQYDLTGVESKPKPTPTPVPISPLPPPVVNTGKYKNGSYTGVIIDAYYGNVQVKVIISGGKISDVQFLDYPQDRQTSLRINSRAMPYLTSETIVANDANVDAVSGASFTSAAYRESLSSALAQARI
jgi:uncharacterized protein with FMN-binding domain